jgi:hypothetical protein
MNKNACPTRARGCFTIFATDAPTERLLVAIHGDTLRLGAELAP